MLILDGSIEEHVERGTIPCNGIVRKDAQFVTGLHQPHYHNETSFLYTSIDVNHRLINENLVECKYNVMSVDRGFPSP